MRSGEEIVMALQILRDLEHDHPGLNTRLILYADGEGAMIVQNAVLETVDGIDFTENAELTQVARRLADRIQQGQ